jgi:hypothetical protein
MSDRLALANAIEDAGIERSKAQRVASVIFDAIHDNVATKADVQVSEAAVRSQLQTSEAALRGEIASIRALLVSETARLDTRVERLDGKLKPLADQIMLRLGALMVVLTGVILAALRYLPPPHG